MKENLEIVHEILKVLLRKSTWSETHIKLMNRVFHSPYQTQCGLNVLHCKNLRYSMILRMASVCYKKYFYVD